MPLALLLTTRLPDVLAGSVKTIDYVESTEILGVATQHVAGRTDKVDFQFWIKEGKSPLPLRVVITYTHSPGQPQFWANFADWNTSPQLLERDVRVQAAAGCEADPICRAGAQIRRSRSAANRERGDRAMKSRWHKGSCVTLLVASWRWH